MGGVRLDANIERFNLGCMVPFSFSLIPSTYATASHALVQVYSPNFNKKFFVEYTLGAVFCQLVAIKNESYCDKLTTSTSPRNRSHISLLTEDSLSYTIHN